MVVWLLNLLSRHTYRPTVDQVMGHLTATLDGSISYGAFDEFYCVPIAHDALLESVRVRYANGDHDSAEVPERSGNGRLSLRKWVESVCQS